MLTFNPGASTSKANEPEMCPAFQTTAQGWGTARRGCREGRGISISDPKPCILSQEKPAGHLSFLTLLFLSFKTIPFRCWKLFILRGPFHSVTRKLRGRAPSGGNNHFLRGKKEAKDLFWERKNHTPNRSLLANLSQKHTFKLQPPNHKNLSKAEQQNAFFSACFPLFCLSL